MDPKNILIVSGGTTSASLIEECLNYAMPEIIIAVDGGLKHIDILDIPVHYIVGDFDTIDEETIGKYRTLEKNAIQGYPKILHFNPEKDDTDTEIAVRLAVSLHPTNLIILGGTGTRLDHTLANIHLLKVAMDQGVNAYLMDENNKIYLIHHKVYVRKQECYGPYISLLPFTNCVKNVTLQGMKYPLTKRDIFLGTSLGISNEIIEDEALIAMDDGILIVIEAKD